MRYIVRKSIIQVVGDLWAGYIGATDYTLTDDDVMALIAIGAKRADWDGTLTRADVLAWLAKQDFQRIVDFYASLEVGDVTIEFDWQTESGEETYFDCLEDDDDEADDVS